MESFVFSHNDECLSIIANPKYQLKIYTINSDDRVDEFVPPAENRYNQLLRVKFGVSADTFESIRRDWMPSWKITKIIFYSSAFSVRHETVFDKPVMKYSNINTLHGIHAEQALTETIPFDNITQGDITLKIDMVDEDKRIEASWIVSILKDKVVFDTPAEMTFERPRTHL